MSSTRYDDDEQGQETWKNGTYKLHDECWELLTHLRSEGYDERRTLNAPQLVRTLEAAILKYRGSIAMKMPAENGDGPEPFEDWDVDLMTVEVPMSGTYEGGTTNVYGEFDRSLLREKMEWTTRPVNLATLEQFWSREDVIEVTVELNGGETVVGETFRPTLPIAASAACLHQIDRVVEDIGWVPPAREKSIHAEVLH